MELNTVDISLLNAAQAQQVEELVLTLSRGVMPSSLPKIAHAFAEVVSTNGFEHHHQRALLHLAAICVAEASKEA
jgi:hypothetical protein